MKSPPSIGRILPPWRLPGSLRGPRSPRRLPAPPALTSSRIFPPRRSCALHPAKSLDWTPPALNRVPGLSQRAGGELHWRVYHANFPKPPLGGSFHTTNASLSSLHPPFRP